MAAQACACCRRIRLDRIALVQEVLIVELLEQPPHAFDVLGLIRHIRVLEIKPEPDTTCHVVPHVGVTHHGFLARRIVVLDADGGADVLLRDTKFLFDTKLDGQTMGVPTGFAVHQLSFLRLVPTEDVLDGTRHHVVYAR